MSIFGIIAVLLSAITLGVILVFIGAGIIIYKVYKVGTENHDTFKSKVQRDTDR